MFPLEQYKVTQDYGVPGNYAKGYHTGVDFGAVLGSAVRSVTSGIAEMVRFASGKGADPAGWGNYVIVKTDDGKRILYAHLQDVNVSSGQRVSSGQKIGSVGSTGNSTGPHLHFEVWNSPYSTDAKKRIDINPISFLSGLSVAFPVNSAGLSFLGQDLPNPIKMEHDELIKMAGVGVLFAGALALLQRD